MNDYDEENCAEEDYNPVKNFSWDIVKVLPTDYSDYGGEIVRWADGSDYPDCSSGCRWFAPIAGKLGFDWGVCANPKSPRAGLLTWEHQAGRGCYEHDNDLWSDE